MCGILGTWNNNFPNNISGELSKPYIYDIFVDKYESLIGLSE